MNINNIDNADCIEVMDRMESNSVDLLLTDIPYNGVNRKSNGLRNLDKQEADIMTFDLTKFMQESIRIVRGSGYIFCGWGQISLITDFLTQNKISTRLCVWRKTNPSPMNGQSIWLSGAEFAVYFKKPNATFNEHCKNCVWDFPSGRGKVHPTEKSLKLFEYLVKASSNEGDIVFDPCMGSGTTIVAAKALNRNYYGIELKPEYFKMAQDRLAEII